MEPRWLLGFFGFNSRIFDLSLFAPFCPSPSRLWNKIIKGKSDFLFAAEAQQIEHEHDDEQEHDSSKLRNPKINYSYLVNSTLAPSKSSCGRLDNFRSADVAPVGADFLWR